MGRIKRECEGGKERKTILGRKNEGEKKLKRGKEHYYWGGCKGKALIRVGRERGEGRKEGRGEREMRGRRE